MKVNLHTPIEEAQVQLIPLIDVIFCILTFFILASLQFTRQQAINIDLPKASSASAADVNSLKARNILPVSIDAVGQTYVEKQPVQRQQLANILSQYLQANPSGLVVLYASRSATYNDVIELLDLLRQVGGDRVSLGIIPGSSEQPANSSLDTPPSFPANPGTSIPNVPPGVPSQPNFNQPSNSLPFPAAPDQLPATQGVTPTDPGISGQQPVAPSPQR